MGNKEAKFSEREKVSYFGGNEGLVDAAVLAGEEELVAVAVEGKRVDEVERPIGVPKNEGGERAWGLGFEFNDEDLAFVGGNGNVLEK